MIFYAVLDMRDLQCILHDIDTRYFTYIHDILHNVFLNSKMGAIKFHAILFILSFTSSQSVPPVVIYFITAYSVVIYIFLEIEENIFMLFITETAKIFPVCFNAKFYTRL